MNDTKKKLDYDDILASIGGFGRWQKLLFSLLWVPAAASAMAVFMYAFIADTPRHRCKIRPCDVSDRQVDIFDNDFVAFSVPHGSGPDTWDQCMMNKYLNNSPSSFAGCSKDLFDLHRVEACKDGYVFEESEFESTATIEFEMVCGDSWHNALAQSLYMAGMLVGSFLFGVLADRTGRKTTLALATLVLGFSQVMCASLPGNPDWYPAFAGLRLLSGMGHVGTFMMAFTLSLEYVGPESRVFCGCLIEVPFSIGGLIVGFMSWAGLRNWRTLMLSCGAPTLLISLYWFFLPESPRWLLVTGNYAEFEMEVRKTARRNRTENSELTRLIRQETSESVAGGHASLVDLFRPRQICVRTLSMFYNWLVTTLSYYGLTMTASSLSSDLYLNYTLLIVVEVPAIVFLIFVMDKFGRKPALAFSQILAGVACISGGLMSTTSFYWLPIILTMVGKFGSTCAFAIVFIYTAELFPTEIRSSAVGSSSTCSRIGGILAPQVATLASVWSPLPLLFMGTSALLGGILVLLVLPETLGKKLPENMEEAINLGKQQMK